MLPLAALLVTTSFYHAQAQSLAAYPMREGDAPSNVVAETEIAEAGTPRLLPDSVYSGRRQKHRAESANVNPYAPSREEQPQRVIVFDSSVQGKRLQDGSMAYSGFDALAPAAGPATGSDTGKKESNALPTLTLPPIDNVSTSKDSLQLPPLPAATAAPLPPVMQETSKVSPPAAPGSVGSLPPIEELNKPESAASDTVPKPDINSYLEPKETLPVVAAKPADTKALEEAPKEIVDALKSTDAQKSKVEKIVDPTIATASQPLKSPEPLNPAPIASDTSTELPPLVLSDTQKKTSALPLAATQTLPPSPENSGLKPLPLPLPSADAQSVEPQSQQAAPLPLPEKVTPTTGSVAIVAPGIPDQTLPAALPNADTATTSTATTSTISSDAQTALPATDVIKSEPTQATTQTNTAEPATATTTESKQDTTATAKTEPSAPENTASSTTKAGTAQEAVTTESSKKSKTSATASTEDENSKDAKEDDVVVPKKYAIFNDATQGKIIDRVKKPNEKLLVSGDENQDEVFEHESVGIKIAVRRPSLAATNQLEEAFDLVNSGDLKGGIKAYEAILSVHPNSKNALFGAATTYQKIGNVDMAKEYYHRLLKQIPNNKEVLNNYLALVGETSPNEALNQLEALEDKNPNYSPIPAQMSLLYQKLGDAHRAITKMNRAVSISPDNTVYLYNLAILLDKVGDWAQAAELYQQLVEAGERGETIPARQADIQERLTFIRSNSVNKVM